ncbi:TadE/TadG family type IV pilus assembly protein [Falsiroseomonas sp. HW251]|uniref:TadE/TadG family type IV pilus assembly protein n=1 Tax=Falsiroseomonas sp. HW251 TaxID=3390998 RepID=UPI003D31D598
MTVPSALAKHPRRRLGQRAVAAVEFALIAPILVTLLGGALDLGRGVERAIKLESIARTAAQYVQMNSQEVSSGALIDVSSATVSSSSAVSNDNQIGATVTVSSSTCTCVTSAGALSGTPSSGDCSSVCTYGLAKFRTVTVTLAFTPWLPTSNLIPFNALGTQSRSVVVRL